MSRINSLDDTIAAIATAQGIAGIGIVRISGKGALKIADKIFLSKDKNKPSKFKTYTMHYGWVVNKSAGKKEIIDEVILALMKAPRSYTKENTVEVNCHGGIIALRKVLDLVLASGARLAERSEEHTSELQSHSFISYAVFCLKKKKTKSKIKKKIKKIKLFS